MGKGSNTTTTSQNQTYTPTGGADINAALQKAQGAANLPFNIPQAPVAGFSQDQQNAFQTVNNAQGMAQPYINQAQQYFTPQGAQSFFNPAVDAVTAQMQNIFGQQNVQNTGSLTQAAGGVGADRIGVGQANLANQQGLAAGQTYSNLWNSAVQQAQGAGYGTAALGSQAQNAALSGAQAQLGTGGLQQQLSQAQLNSPYQQQLAQAAFPYQQAQFLAGITGSLAPGLGGTTQGTGTQTSPAPSIWSQILGLGTAGAGLAGGLGALSGGSGYQNSTGNYMGMSDASQDALQDWGFPLPSARGGAVPNPFFAEGGAAGDTPIDVSQHSIVPDIKSPSIQPHVPQLNLTPQQSGGGGGGGAGQIAGDALKLATMFMKRGGGVNPFFAKGGTPFVDPDGPSPLDTAEWPSGPIGGPSDVVNFGDPIHRDPAADNAWREGVDAGSSPAAFASPDATRSMAAPAGAASPAPSGAAPTGGPPAAAPGAAPAASPPPAAAPATGDQNDFIKSPWAALMAAGLGIAGGTSPFAGVNIGKGGLEGLKMLEQQRTESQKDTTIDQAAKRLEQEATFHEDQYKRMTPYQKAEVEQKKEELGYKRELMGAGQMSDKAVDLAVDRIHAGDPRALTNLGRGAQSGINLTRIQNRLAERADAEGWTGAELAAAQANFGSQAAAARTAAVRAANVEASIEEAKLTFPLVEEASRNLPRGTSVPWNSLVQLVQKGSSDPRLAKLVTAIQGARTAYSQAMSRTGVNSVHAQQSADQLLSSVTSEEALFSTLGQMRKEMDAAAAAPEAVRQRILARIGQGATGPAAAPPAGGSAPAGATPAGATPGDPLAAARAAIASGRDRNAVIQRLKDHGIDPTGL